MITREMIKTAQMAQLANLEHGGFAAMEAALTAALSVQWQGIDSAPIGQMVILSTESGTVNEAIQYEDVGWYWSCGHVACLERPSRWQPLPPPPTEKKE